MDLVRNRLVLAALVTALIHAAGVNAADKLRVGKPIPDGFDFAILDVGMAKGFYRDENLDIDEFVLAGGAKLHQAMVAGSLDIGLASGTDFGFIAKGAPEKAVAAMAGDPINMALVVWNSGRIKTVADLKGGKVSVSTVPSLTSWLAQQVSLREGWGVDGVQLVGTGGGAGAAISALSTGNIDAASASYEMGLHLEETGQGRILLSFGSFVSPFLTHVIYATDDLMQRNPDALRRFLRAWFRTVVFMRGHKDETVALTQPIMGVSAAVVAKTYDVEMPIYFTDGHFDRKAVEVVKKSLVDMGQVDKMPDDKDLFTEKFLQ